MVVHRSLWHLPVLPDRHPRQSSWRAALPVAERVQQRGFTTSPSSPPSSSFDKVYVYVSESNLWLGIPVVPVLSSVHYYAEPRWRALQPSLVVAQHQGFFPYIHTYIHTYIYILYILHVLVVFVFLNYYVPSRMSPLLLWEWRLVGTPMALRATN